MTKEGKQKLVYISTLINGDTKIVSAILSIIAIRKYKMNIVSNADTRCMAGSKIGCKFVDCSDCIFSARYSGINSYTCDLSRIVFSIPKVDLMEIDSMIKLMYGIAEYKLIDL